MILIALGWNLPAWKVKLVVPAETTDSMASSNDSEKADFMVLYG
jgi:hypothetical protein